MFINVPMNEALGALVVPDDIDQAREIWDTYSPRWQLWNLIRTAASGVSFITALSAVLSLKK